MSIIYYGMLTENYTSYSNICEKHSLVFANVCLWLHRHTYGVVTQHWNTDTLGSVGRKLPGCAVIVPQFLNFTAADLLRPGRHGVPQVDIILLRFTAEIASDLTENSC